ncbi:MAG: molybdenum cofactor sulfurase [Chloroflexi bacterium RBG_13_46_9]|nr:MAG: molybdenum cofactor sulfurase [Chloroflexi bacterium RBG_13_46_9]
MAKVIAVCRSEKRGMRKTPVPEGKFRKEFGMIGDAHADENWHRQVSLLAQESVDKMRKLGCDVGPGDFAENLTTEGIELVTLPIGTKLSAGKNVILEVSQIGKECHTRCAIFYQAGTCVMPTEGIFTRVIKGGTIKPGDSIQVIGGK